MKQPTTGAEQQARMMFSNSVQNVAFALVLSRQMVDHLGMLRTYGQMPWSASFNTLIRRGLVIIDDVSDGGSFRTAVRLSRAGRLMCELLDEASMLSPTSTIAQAA